MNFNKNVNQKQNKTNKMKKKKNNIIYKIYNK